MGVAEAFVELLGRDRPPPKIAMLLRSRRNDAETATGAGADPVAARPVYDRRIDLVLCSVAVDGRSGRSGDHRAASALQRAPDEAVDQWIFENRESGLSASSERNQPFGMFATGVRHAQEDWKVPARLMNDWRRELAHGALGLNSVPL